MNILLAEDDIDMQKIIRLYLDDAVNEWVAALYLCTEECAKL